MNTEKLIETALKYHELTEAFDRSVCKGPIIKGQIFPSDGKEFSMCNQNARVLKEELGKTVFAMGFSREDWLRAIQFTAHIHEERSCWPDRRGEAEGLH